MGERATGLHLIGGAVQYDPRQGRDEEEDCGNVEFAENLLMHHGFAPFRPQPTAVSGFRSRMQEGA
jgi:hypothetical protein